MGENNKLLRKNAQNLENNREILEKVEKSDGK
jgi:hypothetical protein